MYISPIRVRVLYTNHRRKLLRERLLSNLSNHFPLSEPPTEKDIKCIERQLSTPTDSVIGVERERCKYGFPRAFVRHPFGSSTAHSGFTRLACPHLVKEIDALEARGGIEDMNMKIAEDEELKSSFDNVNKTYRTARRDLLANDADFEEFKASISVHPHRENIVNQVLDSGIAGVTQGKLDDAKCLHVHLADYLLRGSNASDNANSLSIGKLVASTLENNGVSMSGCADCWHQCSSKVEPEEAMFWYHPKKNKAGQRKSKVMQRFTHLVHK